MNHGTITAESATVWLGGWLTDTPDNLGSLALGSDTVELTGTLDNRQQTLALEPGETSSTGSWYLNGGRIDGGTITTTGGGALAASFPVYAPSVYPSFDFQRPSGTLDGVTLNGTLDMSAYDADVVVVNGLTLNTDLYLSGYGAELRFDDGSTVSAGPLVQSATIHLSGDYTQLYNFTVNNLELNNDPSETVTLGRNVTVSGDSGNCRMIGPIDNLGTIAHLGVIALINDGSVEASQGGMILEGPQSRQPWSNSNDGTITATQGATVYFFGQWTNDGTITATQGASLQIQAQLSNDGTITATQAGLGLSGQWTNDGTITATQGPGLSLGGQWSNDGTITATQVDAATLGGQWSNDGTITVNAVVDSLTLGDSAAAVSGPSYIWKNSGVLSITASAGATLNLGDYFTTDALESGFQSLGVNLDLSQYGTVNVIGILDNSPADNPITGGTLTLNASTGPLYLQEGEIVGGTITGTAPILASYGAILSGVIVDAAVVDVQGNLTLEGNWSTTVNATITAASSFYSEVAIDLSGTWTNNGIITAPDYGSLILSGTWTNNGICTAPYASSINSSGTWTNNGIFTASDSVLDLSGTWTNNGTITADASSVTLGNDWTNNGTITADSSSAVTLGNDSSAVSGPGEIWKNSGNLAIAPGATIYLGGFFTTDEFESGLHSLGLDLDLSQYTVYLTGILDNSAADNPITRGTLALSASTGPLYLGNAYNPFSPSEGGVIEQGTITTSGSSDLLANNGTLDGVTLDGNMDMSASYANVVVVNGLTLDTDLTLSGYGATLQFNDGGTVLAGPLVTNATIHLSGPYPILLNNSFSQTVTVGRGITISGEGPFSQVGGGPIDNLGTIEQSVAGQIVASVVVNDGSIQASNGGAVNAYVVVNDGSIQASNGGSVTVDDDEFSSNGSPLPWSNSAGGTITATQGATLNLYGDWTNQGTITVDSSSTVSLGSPAGEYAPVAGNIWTNSATLSIAPGAAVELGDDFTTDEFENHFQELGVNLDLSKYTVTVIGTIDNSPTDNPVTGGTLALDHSTGPVYLDGAFIDQGTITTRGSDDLVVTNTDNDFYDGVTLSGVTLDGTLDMSEPNAALFVMNGLTLDTDLNVSGAGASLQFNDGSTVSVGPLVTRATIHLSGDDAGLSNDSDYYYVYALPVTVGRGITISGENPNATISGPIDNLGTVAQTSAGQLTVTGLVNGGSVVVANGGTITAQGWFSNLGAVTVASGGTLTEQGPFVNGGFVTVASGGMLTEQGLFGNWGTLTIAAGGTFTTSGADYIQWAGTTKVDGLLSAANFNLLGGLLTGAGSIQANVTNAATVKPGDPFGTLTIEGNYTQTATGVLLIQIGGANQYGQLAVTGTATLGGTLDVSLLGWYVPAVGTSFQILSSAQSSGDFTTELGLALPHHRTLTVVQEEGVVTLTASD